MNASERRQMDKLEAENAELRCKLDKHMDIYREQLYEIVELKALLRMVNQRCTDILHHIAP